MSMWSVFIESTVSTVRDVLPITGVILVFQIAVLRRPIANPARVAWGFGCVLLGLSLFLIGLELALFPLGTSMASQLTSPEFLGKGFGTSGIGIDAPLAWQDYYWTYMFAFAVGTSTAFAEPALIAVAHKAQQVSGGSIQAWGLRLAVAIGAGVGVALGTFRIVVGVPLPYFILPGYLIVIVQTHFAPRQIIPLAYDSGGVTTSTVTVPLVAALGLGLSSRIPGRDPLIDGFGLIASAALFPMITVMGYAQLAQWWTRRPRRE